MILVIDGVVILFRNTRSGVVPYMPVSLSTSIHVYICLCIHGSTLSIHSHPVPLIQNTRIVVLCTATLQNFKAPLTRRSRNSEVQALLA